MSVLVVGLSHKSAPVAVLERAAVSGDTVTKLLRDVVQAEPVAEAFVVSTCNRVEVYADVDRFHAGVTAICELLASNVSGISRCCASSGPRLTRASSSSYMIRSCRACWSMMIRPSSLWATR